MVYYACVSRMVDWIIVIDYILLPSKRLKFY